MGPERVHLYFKDGDYLKSCFLFGHSDAPQVIQSAIEAAVERQYLNHGIRQYYVGAYGSFDRMAASALKTVKKRYRDMSLYLLLPYHPAERPVETPEGFDGTFCYVHHIGNSRTLLEYAQHRAKKGALFLENLAETN